MAQDKTPTIQINYVDADQGDVVATGEAPFSPDANPVIDEVLRSGRETIDQRRGRPSPDRQVSVRVVYGSSAAYRAGWERIFGNGGSDEDLN